MFDSFNNLLANLIAGLGDFFVAIIILLVAFLVAHLVKKFVTRTLRKAGAEAWLEKSGLKDEKTGSAIDFLGKLVFLLVFILFIPTILIRLGLEGIALTFSPFTSAIVAYVPKVIGAIIIFYIGVYVAKIIRQLLKALFKKIGLDKLQEKLGVEVTDDKYAFANVLAGLVYVIVLLIVASAAIEVLGISAIAQPVSIVLASLFNYIPSVFISVILFIIGYQLAKILAPVVENILASIGADKLTKNLLGKEKTKFSLSKILSEVVRWLIIVIFFVEAINALNLSVLTNIGAAILGYLPAILSALIIMGGGILVANWVENLIIKQYSKQKALALIIKVTIIVVASFMTLSQLGFAKSIVNIAFIIILAGLAIAFAISFGLGGREFATRRLSKLEEKFCASSTDKIEDEVNNK